MVHEYANFYEYIWKSVRADFALVFIKNCVFNDN